MARYGHSHRRKVAKLYLENPDALYDAEFFARRTGRIRHWEMEIGRWLVRELGVRSIVDFGCGVGSYLEGACELGAQVRGYEYAYLSSRPFIPAHIRPHVEFGNAGEPLACGQFDLSMSVEVAEHLLPEQSEAFVGNLAAAAKCVIWLTAAPPSQIGYYHLNLRPYDFWIDKLAERGWSLDPGLAVAARRDWRKIPRVPEHIFRNSMFFVPSKINV